MHGDGVTAESVQYQHIEILRRLAFERDTGIARHNGGLGFAIFEEGEKSALAFGQLTDEQWRHLTEHSIAQRPDGRWGFRYDPRIAEPFRAAFVGKDIDLWPIYERIRCPVLLTRGAESDLLTRETAEQMTQRGPRAKLVEFAGVGHAPMFLDPAQIRPVVDFLSGPI